MNDNVKKAEQELGSKSKTLSLTEPERSSDFLSTGVTLVNLATYGRANGGVKKGHVYRLCGRSSSGKTFMARTILAEAANSLAFDGYQLIYDDVERGALMDTRKFFGQKLVDRLTPPARTKSKEPIYSRTTKDFYSRLKIKLDSGKSVIWIEDSLDSLNADAANPMTDGKAKAHSQGLRELIEPLEATKSILILVSQVRTNMRSMFGEDMTSGGRAPEFYATWDLWLRKVKTLKSTYKGRKYNVGVLVKADVKKNRLSGRDRSIFFPFRPDLGIDDVGSMMTFLYQCRHWEKVKGNIVAPEFDYDGPSGPLVSMIEDKHLYSKLQAVTAQAWSNLEAALATNRKPRYE